MSGPRFIVGIIVFGIAVPLTLFYLLELKTWQQLLTIAGTTFFTWGVADLLASILERPRLKDRTPGRAIREDMQRRSGDATASRSSSAAADRS